MKSFGRRGDERGVRFAEGGNCEAFSEDAGRGGVSRAAKAAFVLGLLSLVLNVFAAVPGLIVGVFALRRIRASQGTLKGRGWTIAGMVCCCVSLAFLGVMWMWSFDAEPVPDDYTADDLVYAGPEYDKTWDLLQSLGKVRTDFECRPEDEAEEETDSLIATIWNSFTDANDVEGARILTSERETIKAHWKASKPDREIMKQLSEFEQVSDLTEVTLKANFGFLTNLKTVAIAYALYARLEAQEGNGASAAQTLAELGGVSRSLCATSRSVLTKLACIAMLQMDMEAAAFIVNEPAMEDATVEFLRKHHVPLTKDELSLRNCLIYEYLMEKNAWDESLGQLANGRFPLAKRHSTFRLLKNHYDRKALCVWPSWYPCRPDVQAEDVLEERALLYKIYNPVGSMFVCIMLPALGRVGDIVWDISVKDDLLQILLAMRLGETYSLAGREGFGPYIVDVERRIIYSPGADGEAFTGDDVKLPFNPAVLP